VALNKQQINWEEIKESNGKLKGVLNPNFRPFSFELKKKGVLNKSWVVPDFCDLGN